jgi:outer membrane protein assembly factor BamB
VRADGAGDVTATHRLWKNSDGLPDIVSPLATGPFVFTVTTDRLVTCFETAKGKVLWEQDFATTFHASPVLAGGVVYLTDTAGVTHVFKAAGAYEAVGTCELGEEVVGTPAFAGGRIYVRGKQNLYCIGGTP